MKGVIMNLKKILDDHSLWLASTGGQRANLRGADLRGANLQGANLQWASLRGADLQRANLRGADLQGADLQGANLQRASLRGADLQRADLQWADLQGADLYRANLRGADLQRADLQGADLDFSAWPLWCGSLEVNLDERQQAQLLYHALCTMDESKHKMLFRYARAFVNKNFRRVGDGSVKPL